MANAPTDAAAIDLVTDLMRIRGRSGQEAAVAAAVVQRLQAAGLPESAVQYDRANKASPIGGEIGNLVIKLPGTVRRPRRLLMAHLDTVPLCLGAKPKCDGERIVSSDPATGLGGDNRAGVAVVLHAALTILQQRLPYPPLTLFFPVQEEIGLVGAKHVALSKLGKPALCFNWDGGDPAAVTVGATGAVAMEFHVRGKASHAGVHPEQGVSAAAVASLAIADLVRHGWHGLVRKGKRMGTSNIGVVSGGEATNVVMPELTLRAEARSHDPAFRQEIVTAFQTAFATAAAKVKATDGTTASIESATELKYESFRLPDDAAVVQAATDALHRAGLTPQRIVGNGGLDANWMTAHGLPTVTLGCGQHDIHTVKEWLDVPQYLTACAIALDLATAVD